MRGPQIVAALLGLVGLAAAAPTTHSAAIQLLGSTTQPVIGSRNLAARNLLFDCGYDTVPNEWLAVICGGHGVANVFPTDVWNQCFELSGGVQHEVSVVAARDKVVCNLYDDSDECSATSVIGIIMTTRAQITGELAKKAKFAKCYTQPKVPGRIVNRDDDANVVPQKAYEEPDESPTLVSPTSKCIIPDQNKNFMAVCNADSQANIVHNEWLNLCVELSGNVKYHVTTITQIGGLMCRFYDDSNGCSGNIRYISKTLKHKHTFEPPWNFGKDIKYLMCKGGDWKEDVGELEAWEADTSLDTTTDQLTQTGATGVTTRAATEVAASDTLAWVSSNTTFSGIEARDLNRCVSLIDRIANHVVNTRQQHSAVCSFFSSSGFPAKYNCDSRNLVIAVSSEGSGREYFDRAIPYNLGTHITHVMCTHKPGARDLAMQHGSARISAREEDASSDVVPTAEAQEANEYATMMFASFKGAIIPKVASILKDSLDRCIKLPKDVSMHVTHLHQSKGYVCKYYRYDCEANHTLLTLDTLAGPYSHATVPSWGNQIEYAMCKRWFPPKRDLPVVSDDSRGTDPPLEQGQLRVGEDHGGAKLRTVINALGTCACFPTRVHPDSVRFLEQSGRSECTYYTETECKGEPYFLILQPGEEDVELLSEDAEVANSASCIVMDPIPTTSLQARNNDKPRPLPFVNAKDVRVTVGHSLSAQMTPALKVGDVYVCREKRMDPSVCTVLNTLNQCVAFDAFANQAQVITQAKGSFCKYYRKPGCLDGEEYFRYMSNPTQDAQFSGWGVGKLAGVSCGGTGAKAHGSVRSKE
jgi:hypothetical protein